MIYTFSHGHCAAPSSVLSGGSTRRSVEMPGSGVLLDLDPVAESLGFGEATAALLRRGDEANVLGRRAIAGHPRVDLGVTLTRVAEQDPPLVPEGIVDVLQVGVLEPLRVADRLLRIAAKDHRAVREARPVEEVGDARVQVPRAA